ncbi:MAG: hypothetical protein K2J67_13165 [Lachnospiraceae bacterium]|nr:hypothetical protein [Lachnospiraceae bacterium]
MEKGFSISGIRREQDGFQLAISSGRTRSQKREQTEKAEKENRKSIYLGNITQGNSQDQVSERYALAQKRAIKKIMDQMEDDVKVDNDMATETANVEQLQKDIQEYRQGIASVQERRDRIKDTYGVDPDSQEQKDLELMQKAEQHQKDPFNPEYALTDEEKEHLNSLTEKTMYQEDMLLCDQEEQQYQARIDLAQSKIEESKATIYATEKALLKTHPMVDAMKDADKIMDAANKERIASLYEEGVDQIEEKNAETQKEMAENKEKALEEKIEREKMEAEEKKREEAEKEMEDSILSVTMQAMSYGQQTGDAVQANIKNLIQDQILLDVDLKGLRVDDQI